MESSVHGKELNGELEVSIPVTVTLSDGQTDEPNVDDKITEENISEKVATIIKDRSIQRLPSTGEKLSMYLLLVGVFLLIAALGIKNKKFFEKK